MGNYNHILGTAIFFGVLFLGMSGYLISFVATSRQKMMNNSYNSRQQILLSQNYRGSIFSRDGEILAETILDPEQNERRVYPYNNLFSHIVGYSTMGRMGVEALANYYLINSNTPLNNKVANSVAGLKNQGDSVYTTLDVQIQETVEDELNVYRGAIVVTEVATGKILAMVSHPDFNPNEIADIWENLIEDDSDATLLNRATQGLYPPGSTFKMITALEYIRENNGSYQDYSYQCNGFHRVGEDIVHCYHNVNHGSIDFFTSFAKSCNSSFANIGLGLDRSSFAETLEDLLFNRELPITLNYMQSAASVTENIGTGEMMQTAFGQGKTQITPLHLNMITSAVANGGRLMKPYVIERVENDEGALVREFNPSAYGNLMTQEEADILKEMLTEVVERGTATKLKGQSYTAAGKTGSAEYGTVKGESHSWFTGFAPAEEPEVCVTIVVEGAGSGGDFAVPIARRIFDTYFSEK